MRYNKNDVLFLRGIFDPALPGTLVRDSCNTQFGDGRIVELPPDLVAAGYKDAEWIMVRYKTKTKGRHLNGWGWIYTRVQLKDGYRASQALNVKILRERFGCFGTNCDEGDLARAED